MAEQCTARGPRGVVVAAAPMAATAGWDVLMAGGNAYDAAVAAALAETVLLPPKCGLGGDLIAIVRPAGASSPEALIAVGGAAAGHAAVAEAGEWSDVGPNSVGPPAAGAGYAALAERGVLGRERLARAARSLAVDGFPWATVCTRLSEQAAALVAEMTPGETPYYPEGRPIAPGTIVRLPGLGDALAEWVRLGADLLTGPVGDAIVASVTAAGGALRHADLRYATAEWTPCAATDVDGRRLWATPAPTHGPSLLSAITHYAATERTPADLHSAVMRAIEEQRRELGDPGGTSIVSAADAEGTVVVIIHSNSYPRFGSGLIEPTFQLPLANRAGRGFTPELGHPNFPQEGRRPATTLHAWALSDDTGEVRHMGGTPGGANQLPWNAQSVARLLGGEERPGVLVASPVWEWLPDDDGIRFEDGIDDTESFSVTGRVTRIGRWGCRSAQQVVRIPHEGEVWAAAADPRTVGLALGR